MQSESSAFFLDTNVLVYAYDPTDAAKRTRAIAILELLAPHQRGAISAQVLGEFFVTVTRKITPPLTLLEAEQSVTNYIRSWTVYDITEHAIAEAVRGVRQHQLSYWDSLIWATAKRYDTPNVLSEDFSDGRLIEGVRFLNPFTTTFDLTMLESPTSGR